jgi:hypothetical protein
MKIEYKINNICKTCKKRDYCPIIQGDIELKECDYYIKEK